MVYTDDNLQNELEVTGIVEKYLYYKCPVKTSIFYSS